MIYHNGTMRKRVNSKKIYPIRDNEVSKTECETPEYMRKQRFSEEEIKIIQEKLIQWDIDNSWKCTCGGINKDLIFICPHCDRRKFRPKGKTLK